MGVSRLRPSIRATTTPSPQFSRLQQVRPEREKERGGDRGGDRGGESGKDKKIIKKFNCTDHASASCGRQSVETARQVGRGGGPAAAAAAAATQQSNSIPINFNGSQLFVVVHCPLAPPPTQRQRRHWRQAVSMAHRPPPVAPSSDSRLSTPHHTLHYTTSHNNTHNVAPHRTTLPLHYTTPHHTTPHHTLHTAHYTTPHHTTLHYTTSHTAHHTTPHHTTLRYATPHHTILRYTTPHVIICLLPPDATQSGGTSSA